MVKLITKKNARIGKYDSIHMYSKAGAEVLTASLLAILNKAGMVRRLEKWGMASNSVINTATNKPFNDKEEEWSLFVKSLLFHT